ncbi:MAG: DUF1579 domain-containing protein [Fimbriimonas sp.]
MSTETETTMEMGTKPVKEHAWLQNLVGDWRTEAEFSMEPGAPKQKSSGTESVKCLGGLWAVGEGRGTMPGGSEMNMVNALGYDVSFKEYRGCWFASMSSHLWKYVGELSADGKTMTLNCEGPDMVKDGETALYRDIIELIDANHRTLTSYGQDDKGEWQEFMKVHYYRL